jgi:hypothetical protein
MQDALASTSAQLQQAVGQHDAKIATLSAQLESCRSELRIEREERHKSMSSTAARPRHAAGVWCLCVHAWRVAIVAALVHGLRQQIASLHDQLAARGSAAAAPSSSTDAVTAIIDELDAAPASSDSASWTRRPGVRNYLSHK